MMEKPYIIWTMRRTGGTTFASLLSNVSSYPNLPHEPFNPDRKLGEISLNWRRTVNIDKLRSDVANALQNRPVIKHCYDVASIELNSIIMQETTRLGYKSILLLRKDEVRRQFSLELAVSTGAWSPTTAQKIFSEIRSGAKAKPRLNIQRSINQLGDCFLRTMWVKSNLQRVTADSCAVNYEDLYSQKEASLLAAKQVLHEIGHSSERISELESTIKQRLSCGDQKSSSNEDLVENVERWKNVMNKTWMALRNE